MYECDFHRKQNDLIALIANANLIIKNCGCEKWIKITSDNIV